MDDLPLLNTPRDAEGFNWGHRKTNEIDLISGTDRETVFTDISRRESVQECEAFHARTPLPLFTRDLLQVILPFIRCRRERNIGAWFRDSALDAFPCSTLA